MSLVLLLDMNLSPEWVLWFAERQQPAVHWSSIGAPWAPDAEIMEWARANQHVVLTHDLDFGAALALTNAAGPSVIQVRTLDLLADQLGELVLSALRQYADQLEAGALLVIHQSTMRVRLLPLKPQ